MARILLVDDDRDIRELGQALLTASGHETFIADGVMNALQILQGTPVDIVITDANMPQHSGFDLVRTLKKDSRFRSLTIAMLTGRRERKDIERALELGVHDYIVKPLDPLLFVQKITDLLQRRPTQKRPEVEFASLKMAAGARAMVPTEIISVSEVGLTIRSSHRFHEGSKIELDTDLFLRIGIPAPHLRVASISELAEDFEIRLSFVGTDEKILTKIRAWIHSNTARTRTA